jgi:hypothetical protein
MLMKTLFSMMTIMFFLTVQMGFCVEDEKQLTIPQDAKFRFALPINWSSPVKYNLFVTIPDGFKSLQSTEEMFKENTTIIEFIPNDEPEDNWTQIITVVKFINKKLSAEYSTNFLKNSMLSQVSHGKVWLDTASNEGAYHRATLGLTYDLRGKHEVIGAQYYSGPYDCVGVQYTIRPGSGKSDKEAIEKIKKFFNTNLQVIAVPQ